MNKTKQKLQNKLIRQHILIITMTISKKTESKIPSTKNKSKRRKKMKCKRLIALY